MPEITFELPHWLYWAGLILFPLFAMFMVARQRQKGPVNYTSLPLAYIILISGGFLGLHRFYVRSALGALYALPFFGILYANSQARSTRVEVSRLNNDKLGVDYELELAREALDEGAEGAAAEVEAAEDTLETLTQQINETASNLVMWNDVGLWLAVVILAGIIIDAILLPRMVRRAQRTEEPAIVEPALSEVYVKGTGPEPTDPRPENALTRGIEAISRFAGEYVAYWSVIAVFVYYFEVISRYVFNSPTNWAHEGMFLMFGMQYLISGAYAYLDDAHVRVDVFYARLSNRGKAIADLATSVFFFIFAGTMLVTGWIFMMDSLGSAEVSFTEWAIQYWPVKIMMTVGAGLILLQGIARALRDGMMVVKGEG